MKKGLNELIFYRNIIIDSPQTRILHRNINTF